MCFDLVGVPAGRTRELANVVCDVVTAFAFAVVASIAAFGFLCCRKYVLFDDRS